MSSADSPMFYDPAGRHWRRVRRTWMALAVTVTSLAAVLRRGCARHNGRLG